MAEQKLIVGLAMMAAVALACGCVGEVDGLDDAKGDMEVGAGLGNETGGEAWTDVGDSGGDPADAASEAAGADAASEAAGADVEAPKFELILPVAKAEVSFKSGGIWPFGVQGGEHPHGHPGIDFEAEEGTPMVAVIGGVMGQTGNSTTRDSTTFSLFYDGRGPDGSPPESMEGVKMHDIYYTGSIKEVLFSKGEFVSQGEVIAYYDLWTNNDGTKADTGWLHLGVSAEGTHESLCPAEYFTEGAMAEMEELFEKAVYQERNEFPLICNECPEGGCR